MLLEQMQEKWHFVVCILEILVTVYIFNTDFFNEWKIVQTIRKNKLFSSCSTYISTIETSIFSFFHKVYVAVNQSRITEITLLLLIFHELVVLCKSDPSTWFGGFIYRFNMIPRYMKSTVICRYLKIMPKWSIFGKGTNVWPFYVHVCVRMLCTFCTGDGRRKLIFKACLSNYLHIYTFI